MTADDARAECERWFLRRGLPHFIDSYSARRDVLTRALPILSIAFLLEVLNTPKQSFPIWLDLVAVVGGLGILMGAWALVNRARGHELLARPSDFGPTEAAVFIFVPALVPIVFGRQFAAAAGTVLINVVLLGIVYLVLSYGVVPTVTWAAGRLSRQLGAVTGLLIRALPMLLLVVTFVFLTAEVWQTMGLVVGPAYPIVLILFAVVGIAFIVARLPRDIATLGRFESADEVAALVAGTPAECLPAGASDELSLSRREWGNVGLVALVSQGIQILLVSVIIGGFFVLLGALIVSEATTRLWIAPESVHVLLRVSLGGRELVVTEPLLRVAGFIAAFTGFQFTMSLLTDAAYRREFRDEVVSEIRQAFAVRARYRASRAGAVTP